MPIPESQLETWSHQGAVATAKATHESIRNALEEYDNWPDDITYDVYLQGSYKNDTNIRGDSDVDVVAELTSSFRSDLSGLSSQEQNLYWQTYPNATYRWQDFRADIVSALQSYYGSTALRIGNKSLKLVGGHGRLPADIVVCMQHRKYLRLHTALGENYITGMTFYVWSEGRWVVNYPKLHYDNGVAKNSLLATGGRYKPTVRIFKNARTYLIDHPVIAADLAPSYFSECLLYNVPSTLFGGSCQQAFFNIISWLHGADFTNFVCQNGQTFLFGSTPEQWSMFNARLLLNALSSLWDNW